MNACIILPNLRKVIYSKFYYTNQYGEQCDMLPATPTVHLRAVSEDEFTVAIPSRNIPRESMLQRAIRFNMLDRWTPQLKLRFSAHALLSFSGDKAVKLYASYKGVVFKK